MNSLFLSTVFMDEFHTTRLLCLSRKTFTIVLLVFGDHVWQDIHGRVERKALGDRKRVFIWILCWPMFLRFVSEKTSAPSSSFSRSMERDFVTDIQALSRLCLSLIDHVRNKFEDAFAMDNNLLLALYNAEERLKDVKNSIQTTAFSIQD